MEKMMLWQQRPWSRGWRRLVEDKSSEVPDKLPEVWTSHEKFRGKFLSFTEVVTKFEKFEDFDEVNSATPTTWAEWGGVVLSCIEFYIYVTFASTYTQASCLLSSVTVYSVLDKCCDKLCVLR